MKVARDDGIDPVDHEEVWLMMEWPEGETKPTKLTLTILRRRIANECVRPWDSLGWMSG